MSPVLSHGSPWLHCLHQKGSNTRSMASQSLPRCHPRPAPALVVTVPLRRGHVPTCPLGSLTSQLLASAEAGVDGADVLASPGPGAAGLGNRAIAISAAGCPNRACCPTAKRWQAAACRELLCRAWLEGAQGWPRPCHLACARPGALQRSLWPLKLSRTRRSAQRWAWLRPGGARDTRELLALLAAPLQQLGVPRDHNGQKCLVPSCSGSSGPAWPTSRALHSPRCLTMGLAAPFPMTSPQGAAKGSPGAAGRVLGSAAMRSALQQPLQSQAARGSAGTARGLVVQPALCQSHCHICCAATKTQPGAPEDGQWLSPRHYPATAPCAGGDVLGPPSPAGRRLPAVTGCTAVPSTHKPIPVWEKPLFPCRLA